MLSTWIQMVSLQNMNNVFLTSQHHRHTLFQRFITCVFPVWFVLLLSFLHQLRIVSLSLSLSLSICISDWSPRNQSSWRRHLEYLRNWRRCGHPCRHFSIRACVCCHTPRVHCFEVCLSETTLVHFYFIYLVFHSDLCIHLCRALWTIVSHLMQEKLATFYIIYYML